MQKMAKRGTTYEISTDMIKTLKVIFKLVTIYIQKERF